jgi:hypothetical protein
MAMGPMHLSDEQVQRLLAGELPIPEADRAREHVMQCVDCRSDLDTARRDDAELSALLGHLDHAPPRVTARALITRARPRHAAWVNRAAAVLLIVTVGGVAWAAPHARLGTLVGRVLESIRGGDRTPAPPPAAPVQAPNVAGIAITPGRTLLVLFTSAQTEGAARVTLTNNGTDVVVRAPAGAAAFTSTDERLVIDNTGSTATFDIEIPRTARRVEIRIAGGRAFVKDGAVITAPSTPQGESVYLVPLSGPNATPSR